MTKTECQNKLNEVAESFLHGTVQPGTGVIFYESKINSSSYLGVVLRANSGSFFAEWDIVQKAEKLGLCKMVKPFRGNIADTTYETKSGSINAGDIVLDVFSFYSQEA